MEPIKRQRKESDSVYTIMLIPHKGHEPRSIHFRLSLLKKVGIVCGLLCLLGAGVLFQSSHILYKAHQDQQELLTYRSEKAVQEQKIGQLLQENEAIEKEMAKIVKANIPLVRSEIPRKEALEMFAAKDEKYKVELITDLPEDAVISTYTQGDFTDLCAGPHCPSTGRVKAFKLQSIAGAYWRGDEKNKMLQRIYGTAFPSKEELDAYLHMLEEAAKRDHRKLGKELDLFSIMEEGPGFPFFHPCLLYTSPSPRD